MWHIVIWNHKSTCIYFQQIYHALCCTRINMYSHITNGTSERGIQGQFVKRGYFQQWEHCTIFVHVNDSRSFQMVMTFFHLSNTMFSSYTVYLSFTNYRLFQIYQLTLACQKLLWHYSRLSVTFYVIKSLKSISFLVIQPLYNGTIEGLFVKA
jgi:hypothetical protein